MTEKPSAFGMGKGNIPDSELHCPDKESVNGHITINIPSKYMEGPLGIFILNLIRENS